MSPPHRWPLHPQPGPLEALSCWLERTARLYNVSVRELLTCNLGPLGVSVPQIIDWEAPAEVLHALAERTGVDLAQLHAMTLAGWVPWLMDALRTRPWDAQESFDTYVRQHSVLLAPGEAGENNVTAGKGWGGPWWPTYVVERACPACAAEPQPRRDLIWQLPITVGCARHGCRLGDAGKIALALALGERPEAVPVDEPLASLDGYTYQALSVGRVALPGRSVHAGVWFRLLRTLLDEVSLALTTRSVHGRTTLERVWQYTGLPERGGLRVWRPYEAMDWMMQQNMLHAAAAALKLAADGTISARGTLAGAIALAPRRHVYDGDRPSASTTAWQEAMAEIEAAIEHARTDREVARQVLALLTLSARTLARFEEERSYLFGIGIPAEFLPTAHDLGRIDLA